MRDLTKGSIIRLMLLFSLPILLGSLFQQAYNLVDIIIVGKKLGELSLSAVGSTTAVVSLMFNIINGLCTGFAIPVAKHYGANDMNKVRRTVAGMITYSAIITAVIMALMYSIVDIGSIVLQNGINGLGTGIISAHTAARKIFSFTIMPFSAISATLVTFVSQNLGAGKFDRIKKSIKYGLLIGYGWSTLAVLIVYLFGEQLVLMIAPADNREIIDTAVNYLRINVPFYYALNTLLSLRCTLQGLGKSVVPIGASIVEMIWKIVTVVAVIPVCGYFGVCISEPIIWTASGLLVAVIAIKTLRAFEKA